MPERRYNRQNWPIAAAMIQYPNVLPDGTTAGEWLRPQIESAYKAGTMPTSRLLIGSGE